MWYFVFIERRYGYGSSQNRQIYCGNEEEAEFNPAAIFHTYLKKDGTFVLGWSHPIHKCVSVENGRLVFSNSYFNEEWYCADMSDKKIMLSNRMMSTYINALSNDGFLVEKLIEGTDREKAHASDNDFGRKALMLPTVFVIKARKL